jgi:hypothetical protein
MTSRTEEHKRGRYSKHGSKTLKTIPMIAGNCPHRHARNFDEHLRPTVPLGSLTTNPSSYIPTSCNDAVRNLPEVGQVKRWRPVQ